MIQVHSRVPVSAAMRNVLHWLSFPQRVTFKLCLLTYKCLHGLEPEYLLRCCVRLAAVTGQSQPPFRRLTTLAPTKNVYSNAGFVSLLLVGLGILYFDTLT